MENNKVSLIDLLKMKSTRMDEVIRYSGIHSTKPETLSQHIIEVQLISLKIAHLIEVVSNVVINKELLLSKALLHDLDEVVTGDFPRPIKYWNDEIRNGVDSISRQVIHRMSELEFGSDYVERVWDLAKLGKEGLVIKTVDLVVVAKKALEEVAIYHNYAFIKVLYEVKDYLLELHSTLGNIIDKSKDSDLTKDLKLTAGVLRNNVVSSILDEVIDYLIKMVNNSSIIDFDTLKRISSYADYYEGDIKGDTDDSKG